jgi:hypothetical protein
VGAIKLLLTLALSIKNVPLVPKPKKATLTTIKAK